MSFRLRTWTTSEGETRQAYIVDHLTGERDERGKLKRSIRTFDSEDEAKAFDSRMRQSKKRRAELPIPATDNDTITRQTLLHWKVLLHGMLELVENQLSST